MSRDKKRDFYLKINEKDYKVKLPRHGFYDETNNPVLYHLVFLEFQHDFRKDFPLN